jgi:hypothetical protein
LIAAFPDVQDHRKIKADFSVDHFLIDGGHHPEFTIEATRYWCGLFSHTRTGVWKGMLRIEINNPVDDTDAMALLANRP